MLQNTCSRLKLSVNLWTSGSEMHVAEDTEATSIHHDVSGDNELRTGSDRPVGTQLL